MTEIFAVYLQASGFPSQSSEYTFYCCRKQLGRYGISLSYEILSWCWSCCFLCVGGLPLICWCRCLSGVRCTRLLPPVLEARSALFEFPLSRCLRTRCRVWYYIIGTSPLDGLWRECRMSLSTWFRIQLALVAWSSIAFSLTLSWEIGRCLIVYILVCNSWCFSYFPSWRLSTS